MDIWSLLWQDKQLGTRHRVHWRADLKDQGSPGFPGLYGTSQGYTGLPKACQANQDLQ